LLFFALTVHAFVSPTYTVASTLYVTDASNQTLHSLSTVDASTSLVGGFGVDGYMAGLAYDSVSNILYGGSTGYMTANLHTIDWTTGTATVIGPFGGNLFMHGLAYNPVSGNLFGTYGFGGDEYLYSIDVASGTATQIGSLGGYQIGGLAFDPSTNVLYGAAYTEPPGEAALLTIDTSSGMTTLIGPTQPLQGIAFDPMTGILYGVDNGIGTAGLYEVEKTTGQTNLVGTFSLGNALGLEFVTYIPIPSAIWFLGFGLTGLVGFRRKFRKS
jgi:hypothetical protein